MFRLFSPNSISEVSVVAKGILSYLLVCLALWGSQSSFASVTDVRDDDDSAAASTDSINPVIEWNRSLLVIVRTPGAQPASIHSTRSFAMLHAAIFDAVNAIDRTYKPYVVRLSHVSRAASAKAAAD